VLAVSLEGARAGSGDRLAEWPVGGTLVAGTAAAIAVLATAKRIVTLVKSFIVSACNRIKKKKGAPGLKKE